MSGTDKNVIQYLMQYLRCDEEHVILLWIGLQLLCCKVLHSNTRLTISTIMVSLPFEKVKVYIQILENWSIGRVTFSYLMRQPIKRNADILVWSMLYDAHISELLCAWGSHYCYKKFRRKPGNPQGSWTDHMQNGGHRLQALPTFSSDRHKYINQQHKLDPISTWHKVLTWT